MEQKQRKFKFCKSNQIFTFLKILLKTEESLKKNRYYVFEMSKTVKYFQHKFGNCHYVDFFSSFSPKIKLKHSSAFLTWTAFLCFSIIQSPKKQRARSCLHHKQNVWGSSIALEYVHLFTLAIAPFLTHYFRLNFTGSLSTGEKR